MRGRVKIVTVAILALCLLMIGPSRVLGVSNQDAATAIAGAEHALQAAFVNVSDAEKIGVNVSGLLSRLDEAGFNLTLAEAAFQNENYSGAMSQAAASEALADSVAKDAISLQAGAEGWSSDFLQPLFVGSMSAGVFVVVLALTWFWFKRHYGKNLAKSRPRVAK